MSQLPQDNATQSQLGWHPLAVADFASLAEDLNQTLEQRSSRLKSQEQGKALFELMETFFDGMISTFHNARHCSAACSEGQGQVGEVAYRTAQVLAGDLRGHLIDKTRKGLGSKLLWYAVFQRIREFTIATVTKAVLSARDLGELLRSVSESWTDMKLIAGWFRLLLQTLDADVQVDGEPLLKKQSTTALRDLDENGAAGAGVRSKAPRYAHAAEGDPYNLDKEPFESDRPHSPCSVYNWCLRAFRAGLLPRGKTWLLAAILDGARAHSLGMDATHLRNCVQCVVALGALETQEACRIRNRHQMRRFLASPTCVRHNRLHREELAGPVAEALLSDAQTRSHALKESSNPVEFCAAASSFTNDALDAARMYLHDSVVTDLERRMLDAVTLPHLDWVLSAPQVGLQAIILEDKKDDAARIYDVLRRIKSPEATPRLEQAVLSAMTTALELLRDARAGKLSGLQQEPKASDGTDLPPPQLASMRRKHKKELDRLLSSDPPFVGSVVNRYQQVRGMIHESMDKLQVALRALDRATGRFMDKDLGIHGCKVTMERLTVDYMDRLLRPGSKVLDLETQLGDVLDLVHCQPSKDIFLSCYGKSLESRLISNNSASSEMEKAALARIKAIVGPQESNRIEAVLTDFQQSILGLEGLDEAYQAALREQVDRPQESGATATAAGASANGGQQLVPMEVRCQVLCQAKWTRKVTRLTPPPSLSAAAGFITQHYRGGRADERSLVVSFNDGSAEVDLVLGKSTHTLVAQPLLAVVLMWMQEGGAMSCEAVAERSGMDVSLVLDLVRPLVFTVSKVGSRCINVFRIRRWGDEEVLGDKAQKMKRNPKHFQAKSELMINPRFKNPLRRIRIPRIKVTSNEEDRKEEDTQTQFARSKVLEAAIVRLLKSRKEMRMNDVLLETIKLVSARFTPDSRQIRDRIEYLIDQEYMERDESNPMVLKYVA